MALEDGAGGRAGNGLARKRRASGQRGEAMPQQKRGLGRGLGALIPAASPTAAGDAGQRYTTATDLEPGAVGAYFEEIPVGAITPNPRQPRQGFDQETLEELAASIRAVGLLQPVVVRKVMPGHYEIVMGERRWRACELAGLAHIPAIVRETSDDDLLRDALIENLHREQLNPLEEAAAYQQLLDDFSATHEELARKVGRSRPHISNTIRLLSLPAGVQKRVAAGVLTAGHARALLAVEDLQAQEQLAHRIVAEGLSVRAVEEIAAIGAQAAKAHGQRHETRPKPVAPGLKDLADRLSDAFETRVRVELGQRKGKIVVEFASLDDLERIVAAMAPGWAQSRSA
jgi:ParB family transcriptional regulator, chromosome partitioning protein